MRVSAFTRLFFFPVYILYVDESGDPANQDEGNFVLAGIAVFERQTYWLSQQVDALEVEVFGAPPAAGEDRHAQKWDSFVIFRIKRGNYLKDIETLLMHLVTTHTGATRSIAASAIHE